jgi:hypothetical protein
MNKIKFKDAQQVKAIYNFKNIKETFCRAKAAVWYKAPEVLVGFMILCCY